MSFLMVCALLTACRYVVLLLLVELVSASPSVANGIGCVAGAVVGRLCTYQFTFYGISRHHHALWKYAGMRTTGLGANVIIVHRLTAPNVCCIIAHVAATGVTLFFNFSSNDLWTFSPKTAERADA